MSSKVIVELVAPTIIVLFSSGFAQISNADSTNRNTTDSEENTDKNTASDVTTDSNIDSRGSSNERITTAIDDDVLRNIGDIIGQRLPINFCGVLGWKRVVSVNASSGECPNNFRLDSAGSGNRICRGDIRAPGRSWVHQATLLKMWSELHSKRISLHRRSH